MLEQKSGYLNVWGDTVDFKELLCGMIFGAVTGYASFAGGAWYLKAFHPGLTKGLLMGYALIFGVIGCLFVGAITAKIFKTKRRFIEDDSVIDKTATLSELNLNLFNEAEYLKNVPTDVLEEMHQLGIYELFAVKEAEKESGNNGR